MLAGQLKAYEQEQEKKIKQKQPNLESTKKPRFFWKGETCKSGDDLEQECNDHLLRKGKRDIQKFAVTKLSTRHFTKKPETLLPGELDQISFYYKKIKQDNPLDVKPTSQDRWLTRPPLAFLPEDFSKVTEAEIAELQNSAT